LDKLGSLQLKSEGRARKAKPGNHRLLWFDEALRKDMKRGGLPLGAFQVFGEKRAVAKGNNPPGG
jgi:hypothetical protein